MGGCSVDCLQVGAELGAAAVLMAGNGLQLNAESGHEMKLRLITFCFIIGVFQNSFSLKT